MNGRYYVCGTRSVQQLNRHLKNACLVGVVSFVRFEPPVTRVWSL